MATFSSLISSAFQLLEDQVESDTSYQSQLLRHIYESGKKCTISLREQQKNAITTCVGEITFITYQATFKTYNSLLGQLFILDMDGVVHENASRNAQSILEIIQSGGSNVSVNVTITDYETLQADNGWTVFAGNATSVIISSQGREEMKQGFAFRFPNYLQLDIDPAQHIVKAIEVIRLGLISQIRSPFVEGSLQTDAHPTNSDPTKAVWIGMALNILVAGDNNFVLPVFLVGGDIGCGMSVFPLTTHDGTVMKTNTILGGIHSNNNAGKQLLSLHFINTAQTVLRRGIAVETGNHDRYGSWDEETLNRKFQDTVRFAVGINADSFLEEMYFVLVRLGMLINTSSMPNKEQQRKNAFRFILPFMGSLGSSGNHFFELLEDEEQNCLAIIHSGSRGLGAKVHDRMNTVFSMINGNRCVAFRDGDIQLAAKIYDVLNQFALINRAMCYSMIIDSLPAEFQLTTNIELLFSSYKTLPYIRYILEGVETVKVDSILAGLIQGIIHNGITALITQDESFGTIVVKKGAIVSCQNSVTIVANDACSSTPGCTIVVNRNPVSSREISIDELHSRVRSGSVQLVSITHPAFAGNITLPHGAGRDRSANETAVSVQLTDFMRILSQLDGWSMSPDAAGDCPGKAYRSQNLATYSSPTIKMYGLRTFANFKEGINLHAIPRFIRFLQEFYDQNMSLFPILADHLRGDVSYNDLTEDLKFLYKASLCFDLILVFNDRKNLRIDSDPKYSSLVKLKAIVQRHLNPDRTTEAFQKHAFSEATVMTVPVTSHASS